MTLSLLAGPVLPASPPGRTWPRSGTATAGRSPTSAGCPATIVYDRTKTVVKRHVGPVSAVPLHPRGRRVRRALRVRHRRAGRLPAHRQGPGGTAGEHRARPRARRPAFRLASPSWTPRSRAGCRSAAPRSTAPTARSIAVRAEADRAAAVAAARPALPGHRAHLRRVGKDCLVSFEASALLGPGPRVRAGNGSSSASTRGRSRSARWPGPTGPAGWPRTPAPATRAAGWSTRRTGTDCPTDTPARSPRTRRPARPTPPAVPSRRCPRAAVRSCWPAGTPTSPSPPAR